MKFFSGIKNLQGIRLNYKMTVFVICVAISTLIWFLIKLSDVYNSEISFPVKYINPPQGKILVNEVDSIITLNIQDKGYTIAALRYLRRSTPFEVDMSKLRLHRKGRQYESRINTLTWVQSLANEYGFEGEIFYIYPDTINFLFESEATGKIPVRPNVKINLKKQYFLYDSIHTEPSEVSINGLSNEIDTISFIETEQIEFKNLDNTVNVMVKLIKPDVPGNITTNPEEVKLIINVEKFTESEISVPITEKNNTEKLRLKLFPESVKITYLVSLKDFKKITPDMFSCTVDLLNVNENTNTKIPVITNSYPRFVKIVRLQPSEVDYLILK